MLSSGSRILQPLPPCWPDCHCFLVFGGFFFFCFCFFIEENTIFKIYFYFKCIVLVSMGTHRGQKSVGSPELELPAVVNRPVVGAGH